MFRVGWMDAVVKAGNDEGGVGMFASDDLCPFNAIHVCQRGSCPGHAYSELAWSSGFRFRAPPFGPQDSCQWRTGLVFRAAIVFLCLSAWGRPLGREIKYLHALLLTPPCPGFLCRASVHLWMFALLFLYAEPAPSGYSCSSLCLSLNPILTFAAIVSACLYFYREKGA